MHRLPCPDEGVALEVLRECYEDHHNQGFFPHAEDGGSNDGQGREHLEANLTLAKSSDGFHHHFSPTSSNAEQGHKRHDDVPCPRRLKHEHHGQEKRGYGATHQTTLVRPKALRRRDAKHGRAAQHLVQCSISVDDEAGRCLRYELHQHAVVARDFSIQYPGLTAKQSVHTSDGDAMPGRKFTRRDAFQHLMSDIGGMPKRPKHPSDFGNGPDREVHIDFDFTARR